MTRPATRLRMAARARSAASTGQEGAGRATVSQVVQATSPAMVATARTGRRSSPAVRASATIQARLTHRKARMPSDSTARPRSASDGPRPAAPTSPPVTGARLSGAGDGLLDPGLRLLGLRVPGLVPGRGPGRGHHPGQGRGHHLDLLGVQVAGEVLVD